MLCTTDSAYSSSVNVMVSSDVDHMIDVNIVINMSVRELIPIVQK